MTDSKPYWELHVTMIADHAVARRAVEGIEWKFSAIDGDPVLGSGVKCYATRHVNKRVPFESVKEMVEDAGGALALPGIAVVRIKVESVDFDRRFL